MLVVILGITGWTTLMKGFEQYRAEVEKIYGKKVSPQAARRGALGPPPIVKKLPSDVVGRAKACEVAVERLPENRAVFEVLEACEQRILPLRDVSFGSSSGAGSPGMASPAGSDDGTLSRGLLEKV